MRRATGLLALTLVAGACSVTTPRHETALVNANRVGTAAAAGDTTSASSADAATGALSPDEAADAILAAL